MKRILPLATTTQGYPPLSNNPNGPAGWDQIQLALQESIGAIMKALGLNVSISVLLGGASITISGGNYSTTAGWVWSAGDAGGVGELFYLPAIATTSMGGHTYLNASINALDISAADPITYIGGGIFSPHANRSIKLTPADSPSVAAYTAPTACLPYGLFTVLDDASGWVSIANHLPVISVGVGGGPAFTTGYSIYNRLSFVKNEVSGIVTIQGDFTCAGSSSSGLLFQLPAGYRPLSPVYGTFMTDSENYSIYKTNVAYELIVNTNGFISVGSAGLPMDAGSYRIIIPPFTTN